MNNVLIIGNGFDLALGYKTKYEHFMTFILSAKDKNLDELTDYIKNEWGILNVKQSEIVTIHNLIKKNIGHNLILNYFCKYHEKTLTWADFETELLHIGQCLESIIIALESDKTKIFDGYEIELHYDGDLKYYSNYLAFISHNDLFDININGFIHHDDGYYVYFTIIDKRIKSECKSTRSMVLKFIELLPKIYYEDILELSKLFESYLKIESSRSFNILLPKYDILHVITYNYTNFCQYFCSSVFHINGEISTPGSSSVGTIFGIDSDANFRTTGFIGATKKIQRAAHGIKLSSLEHYFDEIESLYIFGYSLTVADKESIKLIFDTIKARGIKKVIIFYKSYDDQNKDLLAKIDLINNLKTILEDGFDHLINYIEFRKSDDFFHK